MSNAAGGAVAIEQGKRARAGMAAEAALAANPDALAVVPYDEADAAASAGGGAAAAEPDRRCSIM